MNQFFNQLVSKATKMIHSEEFKSRNIIEPTAFTRNRKLIFPIMTALILNMLRRTMQIELDDFFSYILNSESVTKQAFFKSRKNIKPDAFKELFEMTREMIFDNNKIRRFKRYRIFAIDGSNSGLIRARQTENILDRGQIQRVIKQVQEFPYFLMSFPILLWTRR